MDKSREQQMKEDEILRYQEMEETTALFVEYFRNELVNNPSRRLKGYLVLEDTIRLIQKKDIRRRCILEGDAPPPARQGSIICTGTHNPIHRVLTACFIAYLVRINLEKEAEEYPYKKFQIEYEHFTELRYYKDRFIKYKKEEYRIPFMKVDIKW